MSVDTNTTNKNLAPYSQVRHPEFTILISPVLSGLASQMRIVTKGKFLKQLAVELSDERYRPAYAPNDSC